MFSDEFGGKALGEKVYCAMIYYDMTMRSYPSLQEIFISKERAQEYIDNILKQYNSKFDYQIIEKTIK